jgi:hypothetical protein
MKQLLIDMMGAMMPFMKTPVLIGGGLVVVGLLLLAAKLFSGRGPGLGVVAWVLVALGVFYVICQLMGMYLGMVPTINFGDPRKFEFRTVEFWKIGAIFLASGAVYLFAAKRK